MQRRARTSSSSIRESIRATATTGSDYHRLTERRASPSEYAKTRDAAARDTLIGAMLIHTGEADGMLCGTFGTHDLHLHYIDQVIGRRPGVRALLRR